MKIFMRNLYKENDAPKGVFSTWAEIVYEQYVNSILCGITINMETKKIKIRIASRFKDGEFIEADKNYLLSYEEKAAILSYLLRVIFVETDYTENSIQFFPYRTLPYNVIFFKLIESNRADKDFKENFDTFIDEIRKYRYEDNEENRLVLNILNALSVINEHENKLNLGKEVYVDMLNNILEKEAKVYEELLNVYLCFIDSRARINVHKEVQNLKTVYFSTITDIEDELPNLA